MYGRGVQNFIFLFLLFFLPLVVSPFGSFAYEQPKIFLAQIGIEILGVLSLFHLQKYKTLARSLLLLVGAFFLLSIPSLFATTYDSFFGNIYRLQGLFLFWHLLIFVLLSAQKEVVYSLWQPYMGLLLLFCFALALQTNDAGRAVGTLGEPNALAAVAVFLFPLVWGKAGLKEKVLASICVMGILYLSGSRSGLLAWGIELFYFSLLQFKKIKESYAVLLCVVLIGLSMVLPFVDQRRVYEDRGEIWYTALVAGLSKPLFGSGIGSVEEALHETGTNLFNFVRLQRVDSAHNIVLDFWIQTGIIGVALFFLLVVDTLRNYIHKKERYFLMAFLGVVTLLLFNPASVVTLVVLWWLVGNSYTSYRPSIENKHINDP